MPVGFLGVSCVLPGWSLFRAPNTLELFFFFFLLVIWRVLYSASCLSFLLPALLFGNIQPLLIPSSHHVAVLWGCIFILCSHSGTLTWSPLLRILAGGWPQRLEMQEWGDRGKLDNTDFCVSAGSPLPSVTFSLCLWPFKMYIYYP